MQEHIHYGVFQLILEDGKVTPKELEEVLASNRMIFGITACNTDFPQNNPTHDPVTLGSSIADETHRTENTLNRDTSAVIGSTSKLFSAATILKLAEDEPSKSYFPDGIDTKLSSFFPALKQRYPDSAFIQNLESEPHFSDISIRNLLQHTSGLGNHVHPDFDNAIFAEPNRQWKPEEMLEYRKNRTNFGKYDYSNTGYELLAVIAETISNRPFLELVQEKVIQPLKLERTFTQDQLEGAENIAASTVVDEYSNVIPVTRTNRGIAAGGIVTTPQDLNILTRAILTKNTEHSLFLPDTIKAIHSCEIDMQDTDLAGSTRMGLFFFIDPQDKLWHPGGIYGSHSLARYDPEKDSVTSMIAVLQHPTPNLLERLGTVSTEEQSYEQFADKFSRSPQSWQERVGKNGTEGKTYLELIAEGIAGKPRTF